MELLNSIIHVPYVFHCLTVSVVLLGAILLFVFGFKSSEEPSFSKIKTDSKSNAKKKKGKEKKSVSGSPKTNAAVKIKISKNDEKVKKNGGPLKDSKNININVKENSDELSIKDRKKKGKENVDVGNDSNDEDAGWERALSRKDRKNKKSSPGFNEVAKRNKKELNYDSGAISKKELESMKNKSSQKEKKHRSNDGEDLGVWQEAKSSKKRRKTQKEA